MKAVVRYQHCPESKRPANIPLNYIWFFQDTNETELAGFDVISDEDFATLLAEQDAWFAQNVKIVPESLTPRQIRLELLEHGFTESDVDALLNTLESPTKEQALIEWKYALEFRRDNPLLNQVAGMLNFTQEDVDHLFIDGATK